jgi:hypothetical protein
MKDYFNLAPKMTYNGSLRTNSIFNDKDTILSHTGMISGLIKFNAFVSFSIFRYNKTLK